MSLSFEEPKAKLDGHEIAVQGIYVTLSKSDKIWRPHYHEYIELLYCTEGCESIWIGGKQQEFSQGDFVVINSREAHDLKSVTPQCSHIVVKFMPQLLYTGEQSVFELKYILPFILQSSEHQRVFKSAEIDDLFVGSQMREIFNEWSGKKYGYELAMRAGILRLFVWIFRYWRRSNRIYIDRLSTPDKLNRAVQSTIEYTAAHYKSISCDEVAHRSNLSYSYFSRSFKRIMGISYSEYVNRVRVSAAERLLISSELSISEIAEEVGFSSTSYFIAQFKNIRGVSPKQFRISFYRQIENDA